MSSLCKFEVQSEISDFFVNSNCLLDHTFELIYPSICRDTRDCILIPSSSDELLWFCSPFSDISCKTSYDYFRPKGAVVAWAKVIWRSFISPSWSIPFWRVLMKKVPTEDMLMNSSLSFALVSRLCRSHIKTHNHLHYNCFLWFSLAFIFGWMLIFHLFQYSLRMFLYWKWALMYSLYGLQL